MGALVSLVYFVLLFTYGIYELTWHWSNPIKSITAQPIYVTLIVYKLMHDREIKQLSAEDVDESQIFLKGKDLKFSFGFLKELPTDIGKITIQHVTLSNGEK